MQVLLSLQSNALKFTEKGSVRIEVSIEERNEKRFLKIEVIDTGKGIKQEDQDKIFKLFGFVDSKDSQTQNKNGIGLGLVISESIINQFSGKISFESVYEEGSTFTFTFELQNPILEEDESIDFQVSKKLFMQDGDELVF